MGLWDQRETWRYSVFSEVMDSKAALAAWEKANNVSLLSADEIYAFDAEKYKDSLAGEPWKKEYDPLCLFFAT